MPARPDVRPYQDWHEVQWAEVEAKCKEKAAKKASLAPTTPALAKQSHGGYVHENEGHLAGNPWRETAGEIFFISTFLYLYLP